MAILTSYVQTRALFLMIPRECRRLAEVDFPIAEVSRHAAREKSIRHGHPSTLHLWWARRPLASSRAVLLALLLPDPCECCPEAFKQKAREILRAVRQRPATDAELQRGLLSFIANFANWKNAADRTHLDVGRALVKAAHGGEPPLVVDPFAGGGSIPLEASRLGCETFAADLNPVACLILKVMLEDIPRHGPGLADELRRVGGEIKRQAEQRNGLSGALEEDARLTALFLWTLQSTSPVAGNQEQDDVADEETVGRAAASGFALPFDVVRRFAQPMGIDLQAWTGRIISQDKGIVRLLPLPKRAVRLFGHQGTQAAKWLQQEEPVQAESLQGDLFPEPREDGALLVRESRPEYEADDGGPGDTTLDRVHTAMLLQSSGHANALRTLIVAEQERGPGFERLANALSALYPQGCNEKRLLDAMLLAVPR